MAAVQPGGFALLRFSGQGIAFQFREAMAARGGQQNWKYNNGMQQGGYLPSWKKICVLLSGLNGVKGGLLDGERW